MTDIIIIAIILVAFLFGIISTRKHFRHQGGCCGGSAPAPKQNKKLAHVIATRTVIVEGMTCDHCRNWVEKSINDIDGAACKVNLSKNEAVVSMEKEISDDQIRSAIEKAGYRVVEIR